MSQKSSKKQKKAPKTSNQEGPSSSQRKELDDKIFGRRNMLGGMFTKSSKRKSTFEEDDGFVFKRSQDKTVSTPESRLNQAVNSLYDSDELETTKKRVKPGNSEVKLSSPIRPKYDQIVYDDSPDEYVEQVSHHTIELAKSPVKKKPRLSKKVKNDRRSSYNNRGKRISSIGNGFDGVPHEDVTPKDYYKLLDTSLPEPHRMKQLLIWCMSKAIEQKTHNNEDKTATNIAKVIKDELLNDIKDGKITTSWYNRTADNTDDDSVIANKEIVLPNRLNITTKENIKHFTQELNRLKREKVEWQKLFSKSMEPLKKLSYDFNVSDKELQKYCKKSGIEGVTNDKIVDTINEDYEDIHSKFSDNLETSIDKLYNITHQWKKINEVVEIYKTTKLKPMISEFTKSYINKSQIENFKTQIMNQESIWPIPDKSLNAIELLKGISRLDYEEVAKSS